MEIRRVSPGNGWNWITEGFGLFKASPAMWIALFAIYVVIAMILSLIPLFGPIVLNLLAPVFMAGLMLSSKAVDEGEELEVSHLFSGFSHHAARLVTVGGMYLVGIILVVGVVFVATGVFTVVREDATAHLPQEQQLQVLLAVLLALAAIIPLAMAYWFAPVLIVLHDITPVEAMKQSFLACLYNMLPFLVYGLASMGLMLVAMLPLGLGLLVMIPTLTASLYVSYKDIFNPPTTGGGEIAM